MRGGEKSDGLLFLFHIKNQPVPVRFSESTFKRRREQNIYPNS